jgi:hypothetical protein
LPYVEKRVLVFTVCKNRTDECITFELPRIHAVILVFSIIKVWFYKTERNEVLRYLTRIKLILLSHKEK